MCEQQQLLQSFDEKIQWGYHMIDCLKDKEKIEGVDKLVRKIQQELKFLKKVHSSGNVKKEHLQSTNLIHLNAIVERLLKTINPVAVLKPFKYQNNRLEVDIVCDGGENWIKVIARNPRALTLISCGNAEYGQKSVFDQALIYKTCANHHPHMYKPPSIIFYFACGIEKPLAYKLENLLGIKIEGEQLDVDNTITDENMAVQNFCNESESETESDESTLSGNSNTAELNTNIKSTNISVLNLDVSTLLAYVTNMTNGETHYEYVEPLLTLQAKREREQPIKPILDELFSNKDLSVCHTAYTNFTNIMTCIGGPNEKERAENLLKRVKIIEDIPKGRIMDLNIGGKVKPRSRLVFATGENLKSITVSSNEGFVRAARMQGIECMVFIHEPRSLSELKQLNAKKLGIT